MSDDNPCGACGFPELKCGPPYDPDGPCCPDCDHGMGYDYGAMVNAPLSEATIAALRDRLASGDYPVRRVVARPSVAPYSPWEVHLMYPVESRRTAAKRRLEDIRRIAWQDHLRRWLSSAVTAAAWTSEYRPPAPWFVPEQWRWANGDMFTEEEALNVAIVRCCGCRCVLPLIGWRMPPPESSHTPTPRCRTCNAEAPS